MTEDELASVQGSAQNIRTMIEKTALAGSGDPFHDDLYLNIHPDGFVTAIGGQPGATLQTYCTFTDPHLREMESVHDDGTQGIIDVADFLTYGLDFASDGGELEFALRGDPDAEISSAVEFYGAVNARLMSNVAGDALEEVPTGIVQNFPNGDGEYHSTQEGREGETFPTSIRTDASTVNRIIEVVNHDPNTKLYPLTVDEGELSLDVGREGERNAVWGELEADEVDGPDVANEYKKGFEEVFGSLSGEVWLQTAPGGAPVTVAQENDGMVIRHVIGNMSE